MFPAQLSSLAVYFDNFIVTGKKLENRMIQWKVKKCKKIPVLYEKIFTA